MIEVKDNVIANAHRLIDGNTSQPQRERAKNQPRRISDQGRRTANLWKYLDEQFKDTPFKMGPLRFYSTFLGNPYINQQQLSGVTSAFGSDFISGIDGPEIITRHLFNADDWNMRFRPNGFQPPIPPAPLKRQPQANIEN